MMQVSAQSNMIVMLLDIPAEKPDDACRTCLAQHGNSVYCFIGKAKFLSFRSAKQLIK